MTTDQYFLEAGDDNHAWDSDYVGIEVYGRAKAFAYLRKLEQRAKNDGKHPDTEGADGLNWAGWSFRIRTWNEDGEVVSVAS